MSTTSTATLAKHAVEWSVVLSIAMILAGIVGIIALRPQESPSRCLPVGC